MQRDPEIDPDLEAAQRPTSFRQAKGAGPWALSLLNHLETGRLVPKDEQRPPSYYRGRRNDPAFREMMLQVNPQIHRSNAPGTLRRTWIQRFSPGRSLAKWFN